MVERRTTEEAVNLLGFLLADVAERIMAVAIDMWSAFIKAVGEELPQSDVGFGWFHVSKHLNEAVEKVRKAEHKELSEQGVSGLAGSK